MEASTVDSSERTVPPDDFDLDSLLSGFSDDHSPGFDLWLPSQPPAPDSEPPKPIVSDPAAESSHVSTSSYVAEIEKLLMEDEDAADDRLEGFDKRFFDGLFQSGSGEQVSDAAWTDAETGAESVGREKREDPVSASPESPDKEDEDPISKKRRRQLRNRDSAMKSRERKKIYVKELEMKTKYLESEYRRLNHLLHCHVAENLALHQCLWKERLLSAPIARQESAVLFVESLPLGSLFWLLSIVCLFLMPGLPIQSSRSPSRPGKDLDRRVDLQLRGPITNERPDPSFGAKLVLMKRRCRGMKIRMKFFVFKPYSISTF